MASSGTVTIKLQSIDYTGRAASGTCYSSSNKGYFNRGELKLNTTINWTVNNSNVITFSHKTSTGDTSWYVCAQAGFTLAIQFSTDGTNWTTIASSHTDNYRTCVSSKTVVTMVKELITGLQPFVMTRSGYIRVYTYTSSACPTSDLPHAYPTGAGSQAVAVPIYIEVDYRPGQILKNDTWKSTNATNGHADIMSNDAWVEMKTSGGGTDTGNPPEIMANDAWVNMRKLGSES